MRWSLILSSFITVQAALSFVCVALPVPSSNELERRAPRQREGPTVPSSLYRANAKEHHDLYQFTGLGDKGKIKPTSTVDRVELGGTKHEYGDQFSKLQADHVFEMQMFHAQLQRHGIKYGTLSDPLKDELKKIMNGKENMALIPGSVNSSKGQLIKYGLKGKPIKRNKVRDDYTIQSYTTAHSTATKLDAAFKAHGKHHFKGKTFTQLLAHTFNNAGLKPPSSTHANQGGPISSGSSSHSQGHSNSHSVPGHSNPGPSSATTPNGEKRPAEGSTGGSPPRKRVHPSSQPSTAGTPSIPGSSSSSAKGTHGVGLDHSNSKASTPGTHSNPGSSSATRGKLLGHSNSNPSIPGIPGRLKSGPSSSSTNLKATAHGKPLDRSKSSRVVHSNSKSSIPGPPGRSNTASTKTIPQRKLLGHSNSKLFTPGPPGHSKSSPNQPKKPAKALPRLSQRTKKTGKK